MKYMRVLIQSRPDLLEFPAGDTVQIQKTIKYLNRFGIDAFFDADINQDLKDIDIIHLFNTHHIDHTYSCLKNAKSQKKKVVVSPIIIDLDEYNLKGRYGMQKYLYRLIRNKNWAEYVKYGYLSVIKPKYRDVLGKYRHVQYLQKIRDVILGADLLIALSNEEKKYLKGKYDVSGSIQIVPNAADLVFFHKEPVDISKRPFILSVGKIEPLKNQLSLIDAYKQLGLEEKLVFIGNPNLYHKAYYRDFLSQVNQDSKILHIKHLPQESLAKFYHQAQVHVLSSWFENAPLVNLEAALGGCKLVITDRGFAKEYFQENAWYCDPGSVNSIAQALQDAYDSPSNNCLKQYVYDKYSWQKSIQELVKSYKLLCH